MLGELHPQIDFIGVFSYLVIDKFSGSLICSSLRVAAGNNNNNKITMLIIMAAADISKSTEHPPETSPWDWEAS